MAKRKKPPANGEALAQQLPVVVPMATLTLDPHNAKDHDEESIEQIIASLKEYGQRKNIVVNSRTGIIEAGNGTYLAAKQLGWTEIIALLVDDSDSRATGYALADNRTAEFSEWNQARLAASLESLDDADAAALQDMRFADLLDEPEVSLVEPEISDKFGVLIECTSEQQQRDVYQRLQAGGFPPAKVLTI